MKSGKKELKKQSETYEYIPLDLIDLPTDEDRFDIPMSDLEELAENIAELGLLQAILVNKKDSRYRLIAGRRRLLATKKIGRKEIKAEVKEVDEETEAVMRASENLQRTDLTAIEEGLTYCKLYDKQKMTVKMIAKRMGKSETHVKRKMDLLRLDSEVQKAIHERKISEGVGIAISKIDDKKDLYRYLEMAIENGITTRIANMWVDDVRKAIQYIDNKDKPGGLRLEIVRESKNYATCDCCQGAVEYKETKNLMICQSCLKTIIAAIDEGIFSKKGG